MSNNRYKIEVFGKNHIWLIETKLSDLAAYDLDQAGYVITPTKDCYSEEEFEHLIEEEE